MLLYKADTNYYLVANKDDSHIVISVSKDLPIPHHYSAFKGDLPLRRLLSSTTPWAIDALFLGCIIYQSVIVYYIYSTEIQTLSFTMPKAAEKNYPKPPFKEPEVLAFFKALRSQSALLPFAHNLALPTLPELTFYSLFSKADAEILMRADFVTRFSIGYMREQIYIHRVWFSSAEGKSYSSLYHMSCNTDSQPCILVSTNSQPKLLSNSQACREDFVRHLAMLLMHRDQRIRRVYLRMQEYNESLAPMFHDYGLTLVNDKDIAELVVEFTGHPLILSLTSDYQLILDALLEKVSAYGNTKEKRLNRVVMAASVEELAERLILQLDADRVAVYDPKRPLSIKSMHGKQNKILTYSQRLNSALSSMQRSITFTCFDVEQVTPTQQVYSFQSDVPVATSRQLLIYYSHSDISQQLTEKDDQYSIIPGIQVYVGSKRHPGEWHAVCRYHTVGVSLSTNQDSSGRHSSLSSYKPLDTSPTGHKLFIVACNIAWEASKSPSTKRVEPPFDFDLIRLRLQGGSLVNIHYIVAVGYAATTDFYPTESPKLHTELVHTTICTLLLRLIADPGRDRSNSTFFSPTCHALSRYLNGESAVSLTLMALNIIQNPLDSKAPQPLLSIIHQHAQQLIGAGKRGRKGATAEEAYIKIFTHPSNSFSFAHGLLQILKAQKHKANGWIPCILLFPNPILLELLRLIVLFVPFVRESSVDLQLILGTSSYDGIYNMPSFFEPDYLRLAERLRELAFSTFLDKLMKAEKPSLFDILSPQARIRPSLYTAFSSLAAVGKLSLPEAAQLFKKFLLTAIQSKLEPTGDSCFILSCSHCSVTPKQGLGGTHCEKCHLFFCVKCTSLLSDGIYYSSYNFKNTVKLCASCAQEEAQLEPICKILLSGDEMAEIDRGRAVLKLLLPEFMESLDAHLTGDNVHTPSSLSVDKDAMTLSILRSVCEQYTHGSSTTPVIRVAGTSSKCYVQHGCKCTQSSSPDSASEGSGIRFSIQTVAPLQTLYIAIPVDPVTSEHGEVSVSLQSQTITSFTEVPIPLTGVRILRFQLNSLQIAIGTPVTFSLPASVYYVKGIASSTMHFVETNLQHENLAPAAPDGSRSLSLYVDEQFICLCIGKNLLECEVSLTQEVLNNTRTQKYLNSAIIASIAHPYRTLVKLSSTSPMILLALQSPAVKGQKACSPILFVYSIACLSTTSLDHEKRKSKENLINQVVDGIVTAAQAFPLPTLSVAHTKEVTYWLPLSLKSSKSTQRLLFASADPHTITGIYEFPSSII